MNASKHDCLKICNEHGVPIADFTAQFCERCVQPECTRSQYGTSQFDRRVQTWEQRLFLDVPRMEPSNPQFGAFQAKRFIGLEQNAVPEIGMRTEWLDPTKLADASALRAEAELGVPAAPDVADEARPASAQAADPVATPTIEPSLPVNTPYRSGQMIAGAQSPSPTPPTTDKWAVANSGTTSDKVVKPGAKIRFGGHV